jgi:hypothetical protein
MTRTCGAAPSVTNPVAVPGADDDWGLTYASLDTSYVLTELEQRLVDYTNIWITVDLVDRASAIGIIDDLLAVAGALTARLSAEPGVGPAEVLCATRVVILLGPARAKATRGSW